MLSPSARREYHRYYTFRASIEQLLPVSNEDTQPFDLTAVSDEIVRFATDLYQVIQVVEAGTELPGRCRTLACRSRRHQRRVDKVEALTSAGSDARRGIVLVPNYTDSAQASEWNNTIADANSGSLLKYLTTR